LGHTTLLAGWFMVRNATFNNNSVISCWSVCWWRKLEYQ